MTSRRLPVPHIVASRRGALLPKLLSGEVWVENMSSEADV